MTVWELIQELAQYEPDRNIVIDFVLKNSKQECPECEDEFEIETEHEGYVQSVQRYVSDGYKALHINCTEV